MPFHSDRLPALVSDGGGISHFGACRQRLRVHPSSPPSLHDLCDIPHPSTGKDDKQSLRSSFADEYGSLPLEAGDDQ